MTAEGWHLFDDNKVPSIAAPRRFTFPFHYVPHPLAVAAARQLTREVERHSEWAAELRQGKMLGVLVARDGDGRLGFLAAFSGLLAGTNRLPGFVPPIYDLLDPDGEFKRTEAVISSINRKIDALEADPVLARLQQQLAGARLKADEALAAHRTIMARAKAERDSQRQNGNPEPEPKRGARNYSNDSGHYIADKKLCKIVTDKRLIQLFSIHPEHKDKVFLFCGAVKIRHPDKDSAKRIQKKHKQTEIAVDSTTGHAASEFMLYILVRQKERCKIYHAKAKDLADEELKDLNDYMEDPVDHFKKSGRIKPVRDQLSDNRCLFERKDQTVISDDAS